MIIPLDTELLMRDKDYSKKIVNDFINFYHDRGGMPENPTDDSDKNKIYEFIKKLYDEDKKNTMGAPDNLMKALFFLNTGREDKATYVAPDKVAVANVMRHSSTIRKKPSTSTSSGKKSGPTYSSRFSRRIGFGMGGGKKTRRRRQNKKKTRKSKTKRGKKSRKTKTKRK